MNNSSFFENKDCEYYPCHKKMAEINCLMCFCPWFSGCGSKDNGLSCPSCEFPHARSSYKLVMQGLKNMYDKDKGTSTDKEVV